MRRVPLWIIQVRRRWSLLNIVVGFSWFAAVAHSKRRRIFFLDHRSPTSALEWGDGGIRVNQQNEKGRSSLVQIRLTLVAAVATHS